MGTDNLFHKRKKDFARKIAWRNAKERVLIVCEGEKTEPEYFKSFPVTSAEVKTIGTGSSTTRLVEYATQKKQKAYREKIPYDQIWCVFDMDDFGKEKFNTAISMAESNGLKVACSNEVFELWYVLHFEYLTAGITRKQYNRKLNKHLNKKYDKIATDMYSILLDKQDTAIKNAKKLRKFHSTDKPADMNPSTAVHLLVNGEIIRNKS